MSVEVKNVTAVEAAKASPKSPERVAFLQQCADMGDPDRIRAVGEFLSIVCKVPIPSRPVTFNWGKYNKVSGSNTTSPRNPVQYQPPGLPKGVQVAIGKVQPARGGCQVEGEYVLTIDGVSLHFALGEKTTTEFSPKLGRNIVRTPPEMQWFRQRSRTVDPFTNLMEYLFFWMHPTNVGSPARMSPDEQKAAGIKVDMEAKYMHSHVLPTISSGIQKKQREAEVATSNEAIAMSTKVRGADTETLKRWSKATGFNSGLYVGIENESDAFRDHLHKVINDKSQTVLSASRLDKLRTMMEEGLDTTRGLVMDAIELGILVMDDLEWYADRKDDKGPVPFTPLARYMVPDTQAEVCGDWLCIELDRRRDQKAIAAIEALMGEANHRKVAGDRTVAPDIEAAVLRAIADGTVKVVTSPTGGAYWQNSTGGEICQVRNGKGITPQMKTDTLLAWASSVSRATVLANIGQIEEAS